MVSWALVLCLHLSATAYAKSTVAVHKTLGVAPDLLKKYSPSKSGTWKCLDGSKEIPWAFVNDDSCDCADGSDEPGTSACPNTRFYCKNEGHIGAFISSSRVRDGLCEPQCCDGSDEAEGVCANKCKEIGDEYRKKRDAELKLRRTGSKIRSTYIQFAHKEKKRLKAEVAQLAEDIAAKDKEVERLRDIAERTESLSKAALEQKKQSPLYQSLISHHKALKALQAEYKKQLKRDKDLSLILDTLRTGYNPNYQDMAVLEAVRGWEEIAGLPHINDVGKKNEEDEEEEEGVVVVKDEKTDEKEKDEDEWTKERLEKDLDGLLGLDHVSLLLQHDEHAAEPLEDSLLFELSNYLPDTFLPAYEEFKDQLISFLSKLGIVRSPHSDSANAEAAHARQAFQDAQNAHRQMVFEKGEKEQDLGKIFKPDGFGRKGEWRKLKDICVSVESGDYTYEVCLFGEVKQKPTKGGQEFNLGRYSSWDPDLTPDSPGYYKKQVYNHGTRCWNGPERSTVLLLECGLENAVFTVQELEKCEYQITGTSPALCLPVEGENEKGGKVKESKAKEHEEL